MRSSGSRVDWKIFFVVFTKLIPRKNFFCTAKILVLMVRFSIVCQPCMIASQSDCRVTAGHEAARILEIASIQEVLAKPLCVELRRADTNLDTLAFFRVFLNLWFGKPMVCVRVAFHENDGNHENDENDEGNSDSYKQGVECWIRRNHGNHENDENHGNPGCKP